MTKIRKKEYQDKNVYEATLDRLRYIYDSFDNVVLSFSGGKDSTAVLNCAIKVAREKNRLPLRVNFYDGEAYQTDTINYIDRVRKLPEVDMRWWCLEFKMRNACSNEEPFWFGWEKGKEHLWVRELPEWGITEHHKFKKGITFQEFSGILPDKKDGSTCILTGVRTQESFRRMKAVSAKKNDNYISIDGHVATAHPIYDWSSDDVWFAVHKYGWDYNKTYDLMNQTRLFNNFLGQRICEPFGEEPLRGLWLYAECFPELWHKMLARVSGVATAWRYANTEIYGIGERTKPEDISYKKWVEIILDSYDTVSQTTVKKNINDIIRRHYAKTDDRIPDEDVHPLTGTSWAFLAKIAIKGDFKGRTAPTLENNAITAQKKQGINSFDEAIRIYGNEEYKKKRFKK